MAKTAHHLREEVLALPATIVDDAERFASLDSEAVDADEIDQLWSGETQRRAAMLESGDAGTLTWDDIQHAVGGERAKDTYECVGVETETGREIVHRASIGFERVCHTVPGEGMEATRHGGDRCQVP